MNELIWPLIGSVLRSGIIALGSYLGTVGIAVTGEMQDKLLGAAMITVGLGWSGVQKWWAKRAARSGAVAAASASAEITAKTGIPTPVTVTVTPGNLPNEAVKISPAEIAKAPARPPLNVAPSPAPKAA